MSIDTDDATVLVVEDDRDLADLYSRWIAQDYETRTVYSGEGALEALSPAVDVVLLDRRLADRHGDDVLSAIHDGETDPRVAMVTAVEPDFDILELGLDDYIVKPVDQMELLDTVERLVIRGQYDDELKEFYATASKLAAIEARKSADELDANEEYRELSRELEAIKTSLAGTLGDMSTDEYTTMFRELGRT